MRPNWESRVCSLNIGVKNEQLVVDAVDRSALVHTPGHAASSRSGRNVMMYALSIPVVKSVYPFLSKY